ncbi:hypothetical protein [Halostagnicola kamekurae]|uniref:Uncharacterized protein n=1 Tax=Halostagnicola kamekurae TaxID=619731 RepID=A0A1I6QM52_9EURY|nr:hypothetical protein [Halostagnicola kamekurae]SFS53486.1 hypothetical protein SAMN04488556_1366 [Halostagnicola kamekurae]
MRLTSEKELKYSEPGDRFTDTPASEFLPASDPTLCAILEEMETPATVDEITDQLIQPANPPIETWADVHERLYEERLPDLEASGEIAFDRDRGTVTVLEPDADGHTIATRVLVGAVSILVVIVLFLVI